MRAVAWLSLVATGAVLSACGGYTNLGDPAGDAGAGGDEEGTGGSSTPMAGKGGSGKGGSSMGTGGSSTGGSSMGSGGSGLMGSGGSAGGTVRPCDNRPCGSTCVPQDGRMGSDSDVAPLGYCDQTGNCGAAFPLCDPGAECSTSMDCPALPAVCESCADGSFSCPTSVCVNGMCVVDAPGCTGECTTDLECPVVDVACQMCPDGSAACPTSACVMGRCVSSVPGCGGYDPCANVACGDRCSPCAADDMNCFVGGVLTFCNEAGQCQTGIPTCGGEAECKSAMDCPATDVCFMCDDGSCGGVDCLDGRCVRGCPEPEPSKCNVPEDCPAIPPICIECPDGSCAGSLCIEGECTMGCKTDTQCMVSSDCPDCASCGTGTSDLVCRPYECANSACVFRCGP